MTAGGEVRMSYHRHPPPSSYDQEGYYDRHPTPRGHERRGDSRREDDGWPRSPPRHDYPPASSSSRRSRSRDRERVPQPPPPRPHSRGSYNGYGDGGRSRSSERGNGYRRERRQRAASPRRYEGGEAYNIPPARHGSYKPPTPPRHALPPSPPPYHRSSLVRYEPRDYSTLRGSAIRRRYRSRSRGGWDARRRQTSPRDHRPPRRSRSRPLRSEGRRFVIAPQQYHHGGGGRLEGRRSSSSRRPSRRKRRRSSSDRGPRSGSWSDGESSGASQDDEVGHHEGRLGDMICERYKIARELGKGTFGRVVECTDTRHDRTVAIKIVRKVPKYTESARIEANILRDVNRYGGRGISHIVEMYRSFETDGHYCLVFEKLGMSLYDFMRNNNDQPYPLAYVREFARQLLETLEFLHSMKLIHTDLKPENILLYRDDVVFKGNRKVPASPTCKVIDFGGATYDYDEHKSTIINTRQYRAPEVILEAGWSMPSDLWSAGCIIAELYTGDLLFATHDNHEHLALMEMCLGAFPSSLVGRSPMASKYFEKQGCVSRASLSRDSERHVRKMHRLTNIFGRDADSGIVELLRGLLTIEPRRRLTATQALRERFVRT